MIRMTPTLERIERLPLFDGLDPRELAAVASRTTTVSGTPNAAFTVPMSARV